MSISPINVNNSAITSTQFLGISFANSGAQDSNRNNQGSRLSGASGVHGKFALVVSQALSHLGISFGASTSTSDTSSTNQAAGRSDSGDDNDGSGTSAVSGTSGNGHQQHYGGWVSNLESNLQNLIQRLSSSSGQGASDSITAGSSSSSSALDALQQSFNGLLSANGGNASLSSFLQSLSQDLQGAPATGNVVTAKV